jgi:hypothetical protein
MYREESVPEHQEKLTPGHESYAELCVLAAGGLLESGDLADFHAHMKGCSECRSDFQEFSTLITWQFPQAQGTFRQKLSEMATRPLPGSRQRFLRRARAEGMRFSREVDSPAASGPWNSRLLTVLAPIAALIVVAVGLSVYRFRETPNSARVSGAIATQQIAELERENSALAASRSQLNQSLAMEQSEIRDLRAQLANATTIAENRRRNGEQARGEAAESSSRSVQLPDEARNQEKLLAEAKDEAARVNQLRANDEASLVEQQLRITELSDRLRIASATLDAERQLAAAGKDVRELMVARQLHVIDVRDTDPNGEPSKAFGRVFLAEGKSLTFYAFDLNEDKVANGNRSFQVWAESASGKNSAQSLGFLHVDNKGQGRWVLKVENPALVKEISAVYVTATSAAGNRPTGEKMLYAYLGDANHP